MKQLYPSKIVRVQAQALRVHPLAQRELQRLKVKKLMAALDLDAIGILHGVQYEIEGERPIWIIDGQHRLEALRRHGFGDWEVEVEVHLNVTDNARASALFLRLNDRLLVRPLDKFKNEVLAGLPAAVGVTRIAQQRGLTIAAGTTDGQVCCVTTLKKVYALDEGKALGLALDTLIAAWGRTRASMEGTLIEGLGLVYSSYSNAINQAVLIKRLAKAGGASELIGKARGLKDLHRSSLARCVAEMAIARYNAGRTTGRLDPL